MLMSIYSRTAARLRIVHVDRNETITRVRVIFAPELRDAMREALIR